MREATEMSRYIMFAYLFGFCLLLSLFFHSGSSQLLPNQVTTMGRLYDMIQSDAGDSSYPWRAVSRGSNPCGWDGVSCSSGNFSVVGLSLPDSSISSSETLQVFCQLDALEALDLSNNHLSSIPDGFISGCAQLKLLNFSANSLAGNLPNFDGLKALEVLDLSSNSFDGDINLQLNGLDLLKSLNLSTNQFAGSVPTNLGGKNLFLLEELQMSHNRFQGNIPAGITKHVSYLDLSYNRLDGMIPRDLLSQPNLQSVDLSYNSLRGPIPANISSNLSRLRLRGNALNGTIPSGSFGRHTKLMYLELEDNNLTGIIPPELGSCTSLFLLNLAQNRLSGVLPEELGSLTKLQGMYLQQNSLVGSIPDQYTQLHSLLQMNISSNFINGSIPNSFSRLQNLTNLNLGDNSLSGLIPSSIGSLKSLMELQLGNNQLRGNIPTMPSSLQIALNLSHNLFEGPIPVSFSTLTALEVLDLSDNEFSGVIPKFLTRMGGLTQVVLSNNQLSGDVPEFGSHVTVVTGGNVGLSNRSPETSIGAKRKSIGVILGAGIATFFVTLTFISICWWYCRMNGYRNQINVQWIVNETGGRDHGGLDFNKVVETVKMPSNIMIKGELYTYYRALMPSGTCFWIKKLYWTSRSCTLVNSDIFEEELKALSQLSNAYIMVPLGYALTPSCAFVVYECPQHGTLFDLLHGSDHSILTWENRYTIAVGLVTGLHRLHDSDSASNTLFHISSRSIFMRSVQEPLIGDVELIKVVNPSQSLGTLSVVAGSVGYIPPEYAYTMRVTKSGNIYGVGTILLELVTGKKAVDKGVELAKWAMSKSIQDAELLDSRLINISPAAREQMSSILSIAMSCVSICPEERPDATELQTMVLDVALNRIQPVLSIAC